MTTRLICRRASGAAFYASLLVSPWIGLGTLHLLTGIDSGAGFQPAYFFMALAWILALAGYGPRQLRDVYFVWGPAVRIGLFAALAVALSSLGIVFHSAIAPASECWMRFLKQVLQLAVMMSFMLYPILEIRRGFGWGRLHVVLVAALSGQLVYAVAQAGFFYESWAWFAALERIFTSNPAILSGSEELFLGDSFQGVPRLRGTACEPLYLGNWLLLVLPFLFLSPWRRRVCAGIGIAGLVLFLLTWSRGAWLAAGPAVVIGAVLARRAGMNPGWRRIALLGVGVCVVVALAVAVIWGPAALVVPWQRMLQSFNQSDWSNLTRFYSMQAGWRAFLVSPVFGVGWGQFGFHFPLLVDSLGLQSQFSWPVVNNFPLQILSETGLFGLAVFLWACFALARALWRVLAPDKGAALPISRSDRVFLVAASMATVGVWAQLLTFSQYNLPHIWVAPGLLLAALGSLGKGVSESDSAAVPATGKEGD